MSDANELNEAPARKRPRKEARRKYAQPFAELERRIKLALPVLLNATPEDALLRIGIAHDILTGT